MRLEKLFHVSFYVALALAAGCLALPATFFLAWMPYFYLVVLAVYFVAWRQEGRWVLSESAANHLGVFIAVGALAWILFQIPRSSDDLLSGGVNWPAGLLPHLGPLLMVLLAVKLFRPKQLGDLWVLQTLGLMMVTLGAVLADETLFGPLMMLYLAGLVWCLVLYFPLRAQMAATAPERLERVPLFVKSADAPPAPERWAAVPRALAWTTVVAGIGFLLFLVAPRDAQSHWDPRQLGATVRYSGRAQEEAGIDLNRTGYVELSDEPAFTVSVRDHLGQVQDATQIRRWRTETLEVYTGGRWYSVLQRSSLSAKRFLETIVRPVPVMPPSLAEDERLVTFNVKAHLVGGLVLAEPVERDLAIGIEPHIEDKTHATSLFADVKGNDTLLAILKGKNKRYTYSQIVRVGKEDRLRRAESIHPEYAAWLANQTAPASLVSWTRELLQRLPDLTEADRQFDVRGRLAPEAHVRVATAFSRHLGNSGEYTYSLELRRNNRDIDATADFVMNVKEGHCERFAAGLALMLRTLGIPCRVVRGYLDAETDESGQGLVRQSQAHTWVEVLAPGDGPESWQWLTLDPTPAGGAQEDTFSAWWHWVQTHLDPRGLWRQLVLDYTPEQQANVLGSAWETVTSRKGMVTLLMASAGFTVVYVARRHGKRWFRAAAARWSARGSTGGPADSFFATIVQLLEQRLRVQLATGETALEFAQRTQHALGAGGSDLAQVPMILATRHYRVRFGGATLSQEEREDNTRLLSLLKQRLR